MGIRGRKWFREPVGAMLAGMMKRISTLRVLVMCCAALMAGRVDGAEKSQDAPAAGKSLAEQLPMMEVWWTD